MGFARDLPSRFQCAFSEAEAPEEPTKSKLRYYTLISILISIPYYIVVSWEKLDSIC